MRQVTGDELGAVWPTVLRGLEVVARKTTRANLAPLWTPEYVRLRILEGNAGLFVCDGGFLVLEVEGGYWKTPYLNVWLAWFRPLWAKEHRQELVAWLDEKTREMNLHWWQFTSPRAGWMGANECKLISQTWRRVR